MLSVARKLLVVMLVDQFSMLLLCVFVLLRVVVAFCTVVLTRITCSLHAPYVRILLMMSTKMNKRETESSVISYFVTFKKLISGNFHKTNNMTVD